MRASLGQTSKSHDPIQSMIGIGIWFGPYASGGVSEDFKNSISLYNPAGYFEPNDLGAYNVNNLTAEREPDGSITVWFGGGPDRPNRLPLTEGWTYLVRMYRPRPEVRDGRWTFPSVGG